MYVKDLQVEDAEIQPLIEGFDAIYELIGTTGSTFYLRTTLEAPNGRIVKIDLDDPASSTGTIKQKTAQNNCHAGYRPRSPPT